MRARAFGGLLARRPKAAAHVLALVPTLVLALSAVGRSAAAQVVDEFRVQDENGQFDFWLPAPRRPDTELTNAAALWVAVDGAPIWGDWIRVPACGVAASGQRCATTELQVGQDMYTPGNALKIAAPRPGARPYAGWLYMSGTARVATGVQSDALTVETGVTGAPSLAEKVQTVWHALIGYPRALGWAHQIPFQAGVLVSAEHRQELVHIAIDGVPAVSIVPQVGIAAGNVFTGANAGVDARVGYGVTTPWSSALHGRGRKIELYAVSAVREDLVAHQLFLDASSTQPSVRVVKEPWVMQYEFGAGARWGPVEVEYRGVTRGREYTTGPASHASGVLTLGFRSGW